MEALSHTHTRACARIRTIRVSSAIVRCRASMCILFMDILEEIFHNCSIWVKRQLGEGLVLFTPSTTRGRERFQEPSFICSQSVVTLNFLTRWPALFHMALNHPFGGFSSTENTTFRPFSPLESRSNAEVDALANQLGRQKTHSAWPG